MTQIQTQLADITTLEVDAIVNAANEGLRQGGGVCGAIFSAAGAEKLRRACDAIGHCNTGDAVITGGFDLPARYIIHTVGPVWYGGEKGEAALLASCYKKSLALAKERGLTTVAFPSISTGIFGYPVEMAAEVAVAAVREFLKENEMRVIWALFDEQTKRIYDGALEA